MSYLDNLNRKSAEHLQELKDQLSKCTDEEEKNILLEKIKCFSVLSDDNNIDQKTEAIGNYLNFVKEKIS